MPNIGIHVYASSCWHSHIFFLFFSENFFLKLWCYIYQNQSILSSSLPPSLAPLLTCFLPFSSTTVGRESKDGFSSVCPFVKVLRFIQSWKNESNSSWDPHLSTGYQLAKAFIPKCFNAYDLNSYWGHIEEPDVSLLDSYSKKQIPLALNLTK